jgi:dihydropteroate synthase
MGVVNATPDSFYDGGRYDPLTHGLKLIDEGANILDIGGQSTRPGAQPIDHQEELGRILPVLREIRRQSEIWISIDTYRSEVAQQCLEEGADMINDVSSFREDPKLARLVSQSGVPVICMHFLNSIHPMPADPHYDDLLNDIRMFFKETLRIAKEAGCRQEQLILDPGVGFGKNLEHNLNIIRNLSFLQEFRCPILVGPSRKSFIGKITGLSAPDRLEGTAAVAGVCIQQGAHILRVHDVQFFRRYCDVLDTILQLNPLDPT